MKLTDVTVKANNDDTKSSIKTNNAIMNEEFLSAIRSYLEKHPADYEDQYISNLTEFLYWRYTESNPEENAEALQLRKQMMQELEKLCAEVQESRRYKSCEGEERKNNTPDGDNDMLKRGLEENITSIMDPLEDSLNELIEAETKSAYIEGLKLGFRLVVELMG